MAQIIVSAGSSAVVPISAGSRVLLAGQGYYRVAGLGTSARPTVDEQIDATTTIGPFGDSCSVQVFGLGAGATYEVVFPTDVLDQLGRPSLVSGAGMQAQISAGAVGVVSAGSDNNTLIFPGGTTSKLVLTSTFSALPVASSYVGNALVTDVGPSGSLWRSNGVSWGLVGGSALLAQGANISVSAGSTTEEDIVTLLLPGGLLGAFGQLEVLTMWEGTVNANVKTTRVKLGGTAFLNTTGLTSNASYLLPPVRIANFGAQNSQRSYPAANGNASSATGTSATTGAVDTSAATTFAISGQKATGTDTLTLSYYSVRLYRP